MSSGLAMASRTASKSAILVPVEYWRMLSLLPNVFNVLQFLGVNHRHSFFGGQRRIVGDGFVGHYGLVDDRTVDRHGNRRFGLFFDVLSQDFFGVHYLVVGQQV